MNIDELLKLFTLKDWELVLSFHKNLFLDCSGIVYTKVAAFMIVCLGITINISQMAGLTGPKLLSDIYLNQIIFMCLWKS